MLAAVAVEAILHLHEYVVSCWKVFELRIMLMSAHPPADSSAEERPAHPALTRNVRILAGSGRGGDTAFCRGFPGDCLLNRTTGDAV